MKTGWSTSKSESFPEWSRPTALLGPGDVETAGELLRRGELVVIPTETVYGLAADATNGDAVMAIFTAKGRPQDNPLIVHVASVARALQMIPAGLRAARRAVEAYAPGPLTVVVPAPAGISAVVRAGLDTVALRVPAHPGAAAIIAAAGVPLAAPSANRSGRPSPTSCAMARWEMEGRVSAIVDGGDTEIGIESTVVDGTEPDCLRILRPGSISAEDLRRVGIVVHGAGVHASHDPDAPHDSSESHDPHRGRSPGTRYRHYQPAVPVVAFYAGQWTELRQEFPRDEARFLMTSAVEMSSAEEARLDVVRMASPAEYAQRLYREFRRAEEDGVPRLYVEIPHGPASAGLRDRILRAAERAAPDDQAPPYP